MKNKEKENARVLRKSGMSVKQIAKTINVSASSVSVWVRDIELSEEQIKNLNDQNPIYNNQFLGAKIRKENAQEQRKLYQELGQIKAKENNPLHMAGCMLYWAEGAKNRTSCSFSNSDPFMLKMFLKFLFETYQIKKEELTIRVNCYTTNGLTVEEIENYWATTLDLSKEAFGKSTTDNLSKYSLQKKAKNKLLYGTVSIRVVKSVWLVQNIFGAIQYYGNFNTNFCLD